MLWWNGVQAAKGIGASLTQRENTVCLICGVVLSIIIILSQSERTFHCAKLFVYSLTHVGLYSRGLYTSGRASCHGDTCA